jgi:LemA protein
MMLGLGPRQAALEDGGRESDGSTDRVRGAAGPSSFGAHQGLCGRDQCVYGAAGACTVLLVDESKCGRSPAVEPWRPQEAIMTLPMSRIRAVFAAVVLGLSVSACGYNTIPTYEEQAKAKWADVQNNYQRRADLIPNLVATVQGYARQEKDVLTAVVEARAKATQVRIDASQLTDPDKLKQFQDAQNQLSGALGRLLAVSENYPELKSNQNFLALQSQLEGTENRIAVARRDYIEAVRVYNTELKTFPGLLWASTVFRGNKLMAEFAASDAAQSPPQVKF